jgi:tetratricopeptide (TPR) repeat protein
MRGVHPDILISLFLIVVTAAAFAPVTDNDFVNYDDPIYVTNNPRVREGLNAASLRWAWTTTSFANWHPLTWMSLELDAQLYGLNPRGYHLTNLLLHLASTVLLFCAMLRLTGARWPSALVAALFAAHPLHVEPVAWVAERKEVLSTVFGMLTLLAYSSYVKRLCVCSYLFVASALTLGLLAKPMLVTMPFVLLLLDFWPLRRLSFGRSPAIPQTSPSRLAGGPHSCNNRRVLLEKLPLLALAASSCVITLIAQKKGGAISSLSGLPFWARCANALVGYVRYLVSTFWPTGLVPFYPHPGEGIPLWQPVLAALLLTGITLLVIRLARQHPYLPTGWFWYLGTLVPVIGLVQVGSQAGADRYTYIPLIGIFIMLSWGLEDAAARRRIQAAAFALGGFALGACLLFTHFQARRWHDSITLWHYTLKVNPQNAVAKLNLGTALEEQGQLEEAERLYEEALRLDPRTDLAHLNLGRLLANRGSLDEATEHFGAALRLQPDNVLAHARFGAALALHGKIPEAIQHFQEAVRLDPDYGPGHMSLGSLLGRLNQLPEAIYHSQEALRINPRDVQAHVNLGVTLETTGQLPEAIEHFRAALRLDPDNANAHNNLGAILDRQGDLRGAESEYREAARLDPHYVLARINLGGALERLGQPRQALEQYREAVRAQPKEAQEFVDLARKFLRLGLKNEGATCFRQAVTLQPRNLKYRLGLAQALQQQGDTAAADIEYQESLRLDSQWPEKLNQAAWTLATQADPGDRNSALAVALAQQVCQATHNRQARFVDTLAAAYASAGQYAQAMAAARQALNLAETAQQPEFAQQIQKRLRLYERNQPYVVGEKK